MTVVAAVRDPSSTTSNTLDTLTKGNNTNLITVKYDALSETAAGDAVATLKSQYHITNLDLVIAVAGIAKYYGKVVETPIKEVHEHLEANTFGPLILFQAVWPLLEKASVPKFVVLSTVFGSTGDLEKYQLPAMAYGTSKAAVNYIVRKIHFEHPNLITFPINPGWVQTEMGNAGAKFFGMEQAPLTLDESVTGLMDKIDNATREKSSGTFQSYDGMEIPW